MTVIELESFLTSEFAEALGLETGKTIFREKIPAGKPGMLAMIQSARRGNRPNLHSFSVQLLGRCRERDEALTLCNRIDSVFPRWKPELVILKESSAVLFRSTLSGNDFWTVSANLRADCCMALED